MKGFLPGPDPDAQRFYSSDSLIVDVASPRYLLAMKLFAARAEIDADDIILLYRNLGFTTVDEGLDAGAHTGAAPWPRALRIHRIGRDYSMTWSFAGPDGRALFRLAEVAAILSSSGCGSAITTSITIDEPKTVSSRRPAAIGSL